MNLLDAIPPGSVVAIDTVIWIYEFEAHATFGPIADDLFRNGFGTGRYHAGCSLIVLGELLVQPLVRGRLDIADNYRRTIVSSSQLAVWDVGRDVVETAAALRAGYRVRLLDALHLGCAIVNSADFFLTNDEGLRRVREVPVLILADYVPAVGGSP
jgi:predicted nucleic acid-binding protein